jgi:hypothetical protein
MTDDGRDDDLGHCEWCGAEMTAVSAGIPGRPRAAGPAPPSATGGAPASHCEWCGAEYPVPEDAEDVA